jgi:hypothetical protein
VEAGETNEGYEAGIGSMDFVQMQKAELLARGIASGPQSLIDINDSNAVLALVEKMRDYHMEFVLWAYYEARVAPTIDVLRAFMGSKHRGVRLLTLGALRKHSTIPDDILQKVVEIHQAARDDIEESVARETLTHFGAGEVKERHVPRSLGPR